MTPTRVAPLACHSRWPARWRSLNDRRAPRRRCCAAAAAPQAPPDYDKLLQWAVWNPAGPLAPVQLKVQVQELPGGLGRGLVALQDIAAEETILSVPLTRVFSSSEDAEYHWSIDMAARLLQEEAGCGGPDGGGQWGTWLSSLPRSISTPVSFSAEEAQACQVPRTVADILDMQRCLEASFQDMQQRGVSVDWERLQWAVQVLQSRCFFEAGMQQHLAVPGVDMSNHSFEPSATVRLQHSPDACQGALATEEVCAPAAGGQLQAQQQQQAPSMFLLVAGERGISAGEEVTICYGTFPNEPFLLLFGFVPQDNPYDSAVLYAGPRELLQHCRQFAQQQQGQGQQLITTGQWQAAEAQLLEAAAAEGADEGHEEGEEGEAAAAAAQQQQQLAISGQGFTQELLAALQQVAAALQRAGAPLEAVQSALPVGPLVADRCQQLLRQCPTALPEDTALLGGAAGEPPLSAQLQLAVRYRANKKRVLQFAADALAG